MNDKWNNIGVRDKFQIINGTVLIASAIILYFLSFIMTLTIGMGVVSACSTMLATGLAFFGITSYLKSQMADFEIKMSHRVNELERKEKENGDNANETL